MNLGPARRGASLAARARLFDSPYLSMLAKRGPQEAERGRSGRFRGGLLQVPQLPAIPDGDVRGVGD